MRQLNVLTYVIQSSTKCKVDAADLPAIRGFFFRLAVVANKSVFLGLVVMTDEL
jgi:hypothetical protein